MAEKCPFDAHRFSDEQPFHLWILYEDDQGWVDREDTFDVVQDVAVRKNRRGCLCSWPNPSCSGCHLVAKEDAYATCNFSETGVHTCLCLKLVRRRGA